MLLLLGSSAWALNKQGAREPKTESTSPVNLTGSFFVGAFIFNPSYAARPNNSGIAALRFGVHVDLDLYYRWLTLSYDENSFTDGSANSPGWWVPSEHDHIVGLVSTIPLPKELSLTLALHYEIDVPGAEPIGRFRATHPEYQVGYTQNYLDAYARLTYEHGRYLTYVALGGFLYNPSYAARPDNSGLALLRYVVHGDVTLLKWLVVRTDFNFFTDRDEFPLTPSELDITSEIALRWHNFEVRFIGEADLPLGKYPADGAHPSALAGVKQFYLATLFQWNFDAKNLFR